MNTHPSLDRLPPHAFESEQGVLGCILLAPEQSIEACVKKLYAGAAAFYDLRHQNLYAALVELYYRQKPIDTITLVQALKDQQMLEEVGGIQYISTITESVPSAANLPSYLDIVQEKYLARRMIHVANEAVTELYEKGAEPGPVIDKVARDVASISDIRPKDQPLTFRTPEEILAMEFDSSDMILGDRLLSKGGKLLIAAAGGTGKSRIIMQLIASSKSGRNFLNLETHNPNLKWMVIQTENSNRRLKTDFQSVKNWMNGSWDYFNQSVIVHTVENDDDCFVSLDNARNAQNIADAIDKYKPDVIIWDPLNEFASGNIDSDEGMRDTLRAITRLSRRSNPNRAIIIIHHARTGKLAAAQATGHDRASFARNSKALYAWARGVINMAPVDPDDNARLVFACGKCNDGREFQPFAIRLNHETMIYEFDPTVDIKAWEKEMAGQKPVIKVMTSDRVQRLCQTAMPKADLANAIHIDCKCGRTNAYRYIMTAVSEKAITHNKRNETFSPTVFRSPNSALNDCD